MTQQCGTCSGVAECRPYGPRGSWICFACAMATPESAAATGAAFAAQMNAAREASSSGAVVLHGEVGPVPLDNVPDLHQQLQGLANAPEHTPI